MLQLDLELAERFIKSDSAIDIGAERPYADREQMAKKKKPLIATFLCVALFVLFFRPDWAAISIKTT